MQRRWLIASLALISLMLAGLFMGVDVSRAQQGGSGEPTHSDDFCLGCHKSIDVPVTLRDGTKLSTVVDDSILSHSVHGVRNGPGCISCHGDKPVPHNQPTAKSIREYRIEIASRCAQCHTDEGSKQADSVHSRALAAGNLNAATCVDCHGAHDITPPNEPRAKISQTCGKCHSPIFDVYKNSVHGAALLNESNPDVPTCINCHGVHNIQDPTTNKFRLNSPQLCASCHANKELMAKYGISTDVFDTYVSDFHGTTITLFEHEAPDAEVNKAVCFDCHGVHDIRPPNDPQSSVMRDNLLATCRKCHPNADKNFSSAWLGHYAPSPDKYPVVYFVNLFYKYFIPGVLGFMIFIVVTDIYRRIVNLVTRKGKAA